jgi:DNA-binding CsgD family transcriptional regulator
MLNEHCEAVVQAQTREGFQREIVRFANTIGFDFVSAVTVVDHSLNHSDFISVDNTPPEWVKSYLNHEVMHLDPVMQHCKRATVPIMWNQHTYVSHGAGSLWEDQARWGYRNGIALAMHLPGGRHFVMGVDRHDLLPPDARERSRMLADVQLFAVHAQDAAMRLFVPSDRLPERPGLTPRELEALRWTMEGKTAWELGTILGITERTAVLHLQNAMRKLGASSKHQAVLKALRLGLIH